jgi:hypothetical protein
VTAVEESLVLTLSERTHLRMLASATWVSALAPHAWAATMSAAPDDEPMAMPPVTALPVAFLIMIWSMKAPGGKSPIWKLVVPAATPVARVRPLPNGLPKLNPCPRSHGTSASYASTEPCASMANVLPVLGLVISRDAAPEASRQAHAFGHCSSPDGAA